MYIGTVKTARCHGPSSPNLTALCHWAALLVLYAFYETYEDNLMEVGHSTPSVPAGEDTTLKEDPPGWTGDDMP